MTLVSMVLTTRDRPRFLQIALRCFQHQTWQSRELIVVDDGERHPVDPRQIEALGGRLIQVTPDTPLGTKLNIGVEAARGVYCQKMDDDDWYGPRYLAQMLDGIRSTQLDHCEPSIAFATPFLFFELDSWQVRRSVENNIPGATLMFDREDWNDRPFRSVRRDEDVWFFFDQLNRDRTPLAVPIAEQYLTVRHTTTRGDRGHTWIQHDGAGTLEEHIRRRPLNVQQPESILPRWAIDAYWDLRPAPDLVPD